MRRVFGFLVAPAVSVLITALFALLLSYQEFNPYELSFLLIPLTVAYASALLFGVPIFALFERLGWLRLWQVTAGSVLCGIPYAVFHFLETRMIYAPVELSLRWFASVLIISSLAGVTFWIVALRKYNVP